MKRYIYVNGITLKISEEQGHYAFRELQDNSLLCTCDGNEIEETRLELEKEYRNYAMV